MSFHFLGPDPVETQVSDILARLAAGEAPGAIEVAQVDIKEEPGRRGRHGAIRPPATENDEAAKYLAGEMACLANTPAGGAIILGVADDGAQVGTGIDADWLRHRIWELTEHRLTVDVREVDLGGTRLLVLTTHEAIEPVRYGGRLRWRVDDHCVDIDPTSWHAGKLQRSGVDWSAQRSGHTLRDVSPVAVEIARRYLRGSGDRSGSELSEATDEDLLRRLHVVDGDGHLSNAGSLLFVGTPTDGIDYMHREVPGGDSTNRIRSRLPLIEQLWEVDRAGQASNRLVHAPRGFAHSQVWALPPRAMREAVVNGVVHRDWLSSQPTVVEHVGDVVTVTSPGGFIGGIRPSNIITHPAVPRYRSLAEATAALGLAEREGIGVDRMVRDMLAAGRPEPEISEVQGPYVRVGLIGGDPDLQLMDLLSVIEPASVAEDVDALLLIDHLCRWGWIDVAAAMSVVQRPPAETDASIARLAAARIVPGRVIVAVHGVPIDQPAAYRLSDEVKAVLRRRLEVLRKGEGRNALILGWARSRGRVSSTEVADLAGVSVPYAGTLLKGLAADGLLEPGRENKAGRGFFYVPVGRTPSP